MEDINYAHRTVFIIYFMYGQFVTREKTLQIYGLSASIRPILVSLGRENPRPKKLNGLI